TDPTLMLEFLRGKASDRKLRLLGVACCRRVGKLLDHDYNTLTVAEGYADGLLTLEDLYYAWWDACEDHDEVDRLREMQGSVFGAALGVVWTDDTNDDLLEAVRIMCSAATLPSERTPLIEIIHDLFGPLPFRTVWADLSWLTWKDCVVRKLAESIYADHAFDRMPILADALQ